MKNFCVSATGETPRTVIAETWLGALGQVLSELGILGQLERLACEILPNETVVARDVKTGRGFVVQREDSAGQLTPAPVGRREERPEPFSVEGLPQRVFHANLSHELRAPLHDIMGFSDLLIEEASELSQEDLRRDLARIESGARDLLALVNAGLAAARVAAGDIVLQSERFDASTLVQDAVAAFEPELRKRGNHVDLHGLQHTAWLRSDPQQLREALLEMLRFANHRVDSATLRVEVGREADGDGTWIWFSVSDPIGEIAGAEAQGLFQVFSTTEADPQRSAASIRRSRSRAICRLLGGDIYLQRVEGAPAALTIRMPLTEDTAPSVL